MNLKFLSVLFCASSLLLAGCESAEAETPVPSKRVTKSSDHFALNERDYFQNRGVGVMVFADTYPESRQSGVIIVSHCNRIASNGDFLLESTPGQWSPVPKLVSRVVDQKRGEIRATLSYPDEKQNMKGFNPIHYPELDLTYDMRVTTDGDLIHIYVDLNKPLPAE